MIWKNFDAVSVGTQPVSRARRWPITTTAYITWERGEEGLGEAGGRRPTSHECLRPEEQ
jgi:hypothetical protein